MTQANDPAARHSAALGFRRRPRSGSRTTAPEQFAIERATLKAKVLVPVSLLGVAALLNDIGQGVLGLRY